MRYKKFFNHPSYKLILKELKKGTPIIQITEKINKKYKKQPEFQIDRFQLAKFAKNCMKETETKIPALKEVKNKVEKIYEEEIEKLEVCVAQELAPVNEMLDLLYKEAVSKTNQVLTECMTKERDMRDFKVLLDSIEKIKDLCSEFKANTPVNLTPYEAFILEADFEEGE